MSSGYGSLIGVGILKLIYNSFYLISGNIKVVEDLVDSISVEIEEKSKSRELSRRDTLTSVFVEKFKDCSGMTINKLLLLFVLFTKKNDFI